MAKVFINLRVLHSTDAHFTPELHPPLFMHAVDILLQSVGHMPFKGVTISSLFLWFCFFFVCVCEKSVIAHVN